MKRMQYELHEANKMGINRDHTIWKTSVGHKIHSVAGQGPQKPQEHTFPTEYSYLYQ